MTENATATASPTPVTWPEHDPATYRNVPASATPLDRARVESLLAEEWKRFEKTTPDSGAHHARALRVPALDQLGPWGAEKREGKAGAGLRPLPSKPRSGSDHTLPSGVLPFVRWRSRRTFKST